LRCRLHSRSRTFESSGFSRTEIAMIKPLLRNGICPTSVSQRLSQPVLTFLLADKVIE
jgi:hypothetical protein